MTPLILKRDAQFKLEQNNKTYNLKPKSSPLILIKTVSNQWLAKQFQKMK